MVTWSTTRKHNYEAVALPFPPDLPLAVMDFVIGIIYLVSRQTRITSPSLKIASEFFAFVSRANAIRVWGCFFLVVGVFLLLAIYRARKQFYLNIVRVGGTVLCTMWATMYLLSGLDDKFASFVGVPVFLYLAYRHSFAPVKDVTRGGP